MLNLREELMRESKTRDHLKHPVLMDKIERLSYEFNKDLLGIPTGGVLIIAQRRDNTLTQYLTWFGKTAYVHGRESLY